MCSISESTNHLQRWNDALFSCNYSLLQIQNILAEKVGSLVWVISTTTVLYIPNFTISRHIFNLAYVWKLFWDAQQNKSLNKEQRFIYNRRPAFPSGPCYGQIRIRPSCGTVNEKSAAASTAPQQGLCSTIMGHLFWVLLYSHTQPPLPATFQQADHSRPALEASLDPAGVPHRLNGTAGTDLSSTSRIMASTDSA